MDNEALVEILKELLNEYFAPVGTMNWFQLLIDALPSIVTIVTIIASTLYQNAASKRETARLIAQNEHMLKLEQMRGEATRKATLLDKQIEEIQSKYTQMLALYSPISDALCDIALNRNSEQACIVMRSHATKLLGLSSFSSMLETSIDQLVEFLDSAVIPDISNAPAHFPELRWRVRAIGVAISDETLSRAMLEGTIQTDVRHTPT